MSRPLVACVVACALLTSPSVRAAAPADVGAVDPLAEAKDAHAEGQALFDTADYAGAIDAWTRAYAALPGGEPKSATYRPLILYNIAAAREKLFELRGDVAELKQAKILLERFDASIDEIYGHDPTTAEAERTRVREKIAALDARIAAAEAPPPAEPPPAEPTVGATPSPAEPTAATPSAHDTAGDPRRRGLVIGGAVLVALGVAATGGLAAGLVIGERANDIGNLDDDDLQGREDRFAQGRRANGAAIAMGVLAPLLVGGGVAMLVIGRKKAPRRLSAAPSFGRDGVGWVLRGRF